ncbi:MAG: type II toxin-antitoxin system HigB family toxin [Aphanizomenon flos-aquae KM1D3_PB]|nr:hypothetical protein OA07_21560 [Aphanizomenon flos-aquae 2012/KM1/D3]QSV70418.1 MAG: type II toxin-antitoxin system HigB family toxin [Aphanizomenon flos-aquae KM1D3_PB]
MKMCWFVFLNSSNKMSDRHFQTLWENRISDLSLNPTADAVGNFIVFNIKGNSYRLIVSIDYAIQTVYYKYFLTHAEYDKEKWKNDPFF